MQTKLKALLNDDQYAVLEKGTRIIALSTYCYSKYFIKLKSIPLLLQKNKRYFFKQGTKHKHEKMVFFLLQNAKPTPSNCTCNVTPLMSFLLLFQEQCEEECGRTRQSKKDLS